MCMLCPFNKLLSFSPVKTFLFVQRIGKRGQLCTADCRTDLRYTNNTPLWCRCPGRGFRLIQGPHVCGNLISLLAANGPLALGWSKFFLDILAFLALQRSRKLGHGVIFRFLVSDISVHGTV